MLIRPPKKKFWMPGMGIAPYYKAAGGGGGLDGSESDGTNLLVGGLGMTSGYLPSRTTFTNAATTAPDGTSTASSLIENSGSGSHVITQQLSGSPNTNVSRTASVYAKAIGRQYLALSHLDATGVHRFTVYADLSGGTITDTHTFGSAAGTSSSIAAAVNGFWKVSLTVTLNGGNSDAYWEVALSNVATYAAPLSFDDPSYTGDGSSGAYLWRGKLV